MTNADDIPMGPESVIVLNGVVLNFRSGRVTRRRMSHPHNDSGNPSFDQSIPGRQRLDADVTMFADRTVQPVDDLQVMATGIRYIDAQFSPYGDGEGGGLHSTMFEVESLEFTSPAEQGAQVEVHLVGHSSGEILEL